MISDRLDLWEKSFIMKTINGSFKQKVKMKVLVLT